MGVRVMMCLEVDNNNVVRLNLAHVTRWQQQAQVNIAEASGGWVTKPVGTSETNLADRCTTDANAGYLFFSRRSDAPGRSRAHLMTL
jgi:hypothetical protein